MRVPTGLLLLFSVSACSSSSRITSSDAGGLTHVSEDGSISTLLDVGTLPLPSVDGAGIPVVTHDPREGEDECPGFVDVPVMTGIDGTTRGHWAPQNGCIPVLIEPGLFDKEQAIMGALAQWSTSRCVCFEEPRAELVYAKMPDHAIYFTQAYASMQRLDDFMLDLDLASGEFTGAVVRVSDANDARKLVHNIGHVLGLKHPVTPDGYSTMNVSGMRATRSPACSDMLALCEDVAAQ